MLHLIFIWQNVISYILLALDIITILFLMCVAGCPVRPERAARVALTRFTRRPRPVVP